MIFAAIDWAEQSHTLWVMDAEGTTLEQARIEHDHSGFRELDLILGKHARNPQECAVAIELHEGLLLDGLLEKGYRVFGINPKSAERARDRYTPRADGGPRSAPALLKSSGTHQRGHVLGADGGASWATRGYDGRP